MTDAVTLELSIRRYEGFAALDPDNPHIQMKLGDLYHGAGRLDDAMKCFERCAQSEEHAATARSRMAGVHLSAHRFHDAETVLADLAASEPSDVALQYNLGLARLHQSKWSDATVAFNRAMELGLRSEGVLEYRTKALHHLGRWDEAMVAGRDWVTAFPNSESLAYLAVLALDAGNLEEASLRAHQAKERDPSLPDPHMVLGLIALLANHTEEANHELQLAIENDPDNPRSLSGLGLLHLALGNPELAIAPLNRAAVNADDSGFASKTLAWAHLALLQYDEAIAAFRRAEALGHPDAESWGGLSCALLLSGDVQQGQSALRMATALDSNADPTKLAAALLMLRSGQSDDALQCLNELVESVPVALREVVNRVRTTHLRQIGAIPSSATPPQNPPKS